MNNPEFIKDLTAGAACIKRRIGKLGSADNTAVLSSSESDQHLGVFDEMGAESGGMVGVILEGIAEVDYGGTITRGDRITSDANGKAVKATKISDFKQTTIDGGAAGDHVVIGIAVTDTLISVLHVEGDGTQLTGSADLTDEFSITEADTINNTGGTSTANGVLIITYLDESQTVNTIGIAWESGVDGDIGSVLIDRQQL